MEGGVYLYNKFNPGDILHPIPIRGTWRTRRRPNVEQEPSVYLIVKIMRIN